MPVLFACCCCCVLALVVGNASETTVALSGPTQVTDVAIRGGSFAATNFDGDLLVTRASSSLVYLRRSLVDINIGTAVPAGNVVATATLKLTVHWGGAASARTVAAHSVTTPFVAAESTWDVASATTPWRTAAATSATKCPGPCRIMVAPRFPSA